MKLKIKKLNEKAIIPRYAKIGDAGMDLTATEVNSTPQYIEYKTGLAVQIPEGYVGLLFPRSSITKTDLMMKNSVGVIDSGYRGEVSARFIGLADGEIYKVGDRVAQLVIAPVATVVVEEVASLEESSRGNGGFGSTGK